MPKEHALHFPKDEKTANDFIQLETASVRLGRGRLCVLRIGIGEGGSGVVFGFHRGQSGPREFLRFEMSFRSRNGSLGGVVIRRSRARRAGCMGGGDGLAGVAHFLDGSSGASDQTCNTDKYSKEAQHRVHGH
jgi:hypothetical protein